MRATIIIISTIINTVLSICNCGNNLSCCNSQCYDPKYYSCPQDSFTGKPVLCGLGSQACNGACFLPSEYHCSNGNLMQGSATSSTSSNPCITNTPTSIPNPVPMPVPIPSGFPQQTADLRMINNCKFTLYFESRYGGAGAPIPGMKTTTMIALPNSYVDYFIPDTGLSGSRFWAKYGCNLNGTNCLIGDQMQYWPNPPGGCPTDGCSPPIDSLFEATWGCRPGTSCNAANPTTWFDTSQVDGWTLPYKLTTIGDTSKCDCQGNVCGFKGIDASTLDVSKCPQNEDLSANGKYKTVQVMNVDKQLNSVDLRYIKNGNVLGCMSPCKKLNWGLPYGFQQPESYGSTLWMCCPTPYESSRCSPDNGCITPEVCRNGPIEKTKYVDMVHNSAPGVYSYSYDDGVGLHACPAGVTKYTMEFCPKGASAYPGIVT